MIPILDCLWQVALWIIVDESYKKNYKAAIYYEVESLLDFIGHPERIPYWQLSFREGCQGLPQDRCQIGFSGCNPLMKEEQ